MLTIWKLPSQPFMPMTPHSFRQKPAGDEIAPEATSFLLREEAMQSGLLAASYENVLPTVWMTFAAAGGVSYILIQNGQTWAVWWFIAITVLSIARAVAGRGVTREMLLGQPGLFKGRWQAMLVTGLLMSSGLWAILAIFASFDDESVAYPIAVVLSALAAGGTGILAPMLWPARIYITAMLLPGSLLMFERTGTGFVMATLGILFLGVMFIVHHRNHLALRKSIDLAHDNSALVSELRGLNTDLEAEVERRTRALTIAAYTDSLTGLPNRRRLIQWLEKKFDSDATSEAAVLFLDLDRFKQINDALGHAIGDDVLREAASRLSQALPPHAILARWGGDEFVLALEHGPNAKQEALSLGETLIATIAKPFKINGQVVTPGLSVGIALYPCHAANPVSLLLAADLAMAEAKRTGRGRSVCFDPSYARDQKRRFDISRALPDAIAAGDLSLHYQPIIDRTTGNRHAYEALARWQHSPLGTVKPDEFIAIADESDMIVELGDWVLMRACSDAAEWSGKDAGTRVAVNVAVRQLSDKNFALKVAKILTETGLTAKRLELEVTESVFADEALPLVRATLESLRALGVSLAIDDFGTGYSSLSRLISLPVSTVKIDRSFVSELSGSGGALIESTLLIARRLGISVVAEGIETAEQAETLSALGVDLFQGYYFGRPAEIKPPHATASDNRETPLVETGNVSMPRPVAKR